MDLCGPAFQTATLAARSRVLEALRAFFLRSGYIEVETPVLLQTPAQELHIDALRAGRGYLRTSPELHMKRLLAAGMERIFQIGPCFRGGEAGRLHNPEFTMLEWYRAGAGYLDAIAETRELLAAVAQAVTGGTVLRRRGRNVDVAGEWTCLTVAEAFDRWAGWNPCLHYDADRFDLDLVEKIEPALPPDRPAVLKDYPAPAAALARCRAGTPPVAERWELYVAGMELANAFSELTDAEEQRRRFEACAASRRRAGRDVYALDEAFLAALARGLPACSGVALGVDRLVMLVTGAEAILDVRVCGGETRAAAGGRDEVIAQKLL